MVDWLNDFAESQNKKSKKMTKKASSNRIIVDKSKFAKVANNAIVSYKGAKYRVIDAAYSDNKGKGVLLERCADLIGDPMEVSIGTAEDYVVGNSDFGQQEYAHVDPQIQDPDPTPVEVAKFEQEAAETEEKVKAENDIDGTSGATHPNRILQRLVEKYAPTLLGTETDITEEINTEEAYDEPIEDKCVGDECVVDEFTEEDFNGLFDETDEDVTTDEDVEFIDDEEFDGEVEDERAEEVIEVPDTTIEAKRNRIASKVRRNRK